MLAKGHPERVWHYFIDAEGSLWHEGAEIDDPALLTLFMKKMEEVSPGQYRVFCQGEECDITAEDVPYVVRDFDLHPDRIELVFPGHYRTTLDPATLFVGSGSVLYCRIRKGQFIARFNRRTYWELAKLIQFHPETNKFALPLGGHDYVIG